MMLSKVKTTATLMPVMMAGAMLLPGAEVAQAQTVDASQVEVEVALGKILSEFSKNIANGKCNNNNNK